MANKILVAGTVREIDGGKCMVGGTVRKVEKGRCIMNGTVHEILFVPTFKVTITGYYDPEYQFSRPATLLIDGIEYNYATVLNVKLGTKIKAEASYGVYLNGVKVSSGIYYGGPQWGMEVSTDVDIDIYQPSNQAQIKITTK